MFLTTSLRRSSMMMFGQTKKTVHTRKMVSTTTIVTASNTNSSVSSMLPVVVDDNNTCSSSEDVLLLNNVFLEPFPTRSVKKLSPTSHLRPADWRRYASDLFMSQTFPPSFDDMKGKENQFDFPIFNFTDTQSHSTMALDTRVFGLPIRKDILQRVVKWQLAKRRQGTHKTKSRSEVAGSTRKHHKQKGSGRARVGDVRAPQWRGGYTVHGKTPRDYSYALPKKVRTMGVRVALSTKLREGKLAIVDNWNVENGKTKYVQELLASKNWDNALFIYDEETLNQDFLLGIRNLPHVDLLPHKGANVYSILKYDIVVLCVDSVKSLTDRFLTTL